MKDGAKTGDVLDDLDTLTDIYKVTACLLRYYKKSEKEFIFEAKTEDLTRLQSEIQNVKGTGNPVLLIHFIPVSQEEKQYATFLSWVLGEIMCDEDGNERGDQ